LSAIESTVSPSAVIGVSATASVDGEENHRTGTRRGVGGVGEAISGPQEGQQGGAMGEEAVSSSWPLAVEVGDEARRR
jgi:hypothetical protein